MIDLTERFRSFKAERALLMSYCVSLPFFEQDVLPYLQEAGEGRVTVLLTESEYQSSFADFVMGAGIRYRFNAVRLPIPSSNFHPKLYLLLKPKEARLLVASANLTPSGFRTNLEIVDELTLSDSGQGDLQAFGQFALMLRSLAKLDPRLAKPVIRELNEIGDMLRRWIDSGPTYRAGPHFLHSIEEPLLKQLLHLVPPTQVDEIVAVSPFFDEHSKAILELAAAYPKSHVRIIKGSDDGSLAGQPLTKLKNRLVVEELAAADDRKDRRLHAKVVLLRGSRREWVVSGSANLTRRAWLIAAKDGGNVEALVIREYDESLGTRLLPAIKTRRVDPQKLFWDAEPIVPSSPEGRLAITDAYLENREIVILLEPISPVRGLHFVVVIEQGWQRIESEPTIQSNDDVAIVLRVGIAREYVKAEVPLSVTVEARSGAGRIAAARSWVAVPSALSLTATQRGVRNSTRNLCQRVFADDDAASVVSDAISRFLGELAEVSTQPKGTAPGMGQTAESENEAERQLSVDEFIVSDEELGRLRDATSRTVQTLSGLAALLRRLLIVADESEDEHAPADVAMEREEPEEPEEGETHKRRDALKAEELLNILTQQFQLTVREAMAQSVCANAVPFVLNLPDAVIAFLLLHARIRQRLQLEPERQLPYAVREILQNLLSVEGVLVGTSFGWLVRAMVSDECRPVLQKLLSDTIRVGQLFAFVAAGLARCGADSAAFSPSILGGLHFVSGEMPGKKITPEMQMQLSKVAASSGGWIPLGDIETVLGSYSPKDLSALLSARKWSHAVGNSYCRAVERESGISCGKSHMSLPPNIAIQLTRTGSDVVCPFCHRVIVPLKHNSMDLNAVLTWFDSALAATQ